MTRVHTAFFDFFAVGPDGEGVSSSSRSSSAPKTEEKKPNVFAPWAGGRYKKKLAKKLRKSSLPCSPRGWRPVSSVCARERGDLRVFSRLPRLPSPLPLPPARSSSLAVALSFFAPLADWRSVGLRVSGLGFRALAEWRLVGFRV